MVNEESKGRVLRELNWKLPDKKNEFTCGNNISRNYLENLRKLRTNQLKIINNQLDIKLRQFTQKELNSVLR